MAKGTCSVDGCQKPHDSRGWCCAHYGRWKRHGDPMAGGIMQSPQTGPCEVDGCIRSAVSRGVCRRHYGKLNKYGDPLDGRSYPPAWPLNLLGYFFVRPDGCWEFTGEITDQGYGRVWRQGRCPAQVAMYEFLIGPVPEGKVLDHRCHVPGECVMPKGHAHLCPHRRCCNPWHMKAVDPSENTGRTNATLIRWGTLSPKVVG